MKKIFITIFLFTMPLIIFIILYRSINGIDDKFSLQSVLKYIETFNQFEVLKDFVDYIKNLFNEITSYFESITIEVNNAWDAIKLIPKYLFGVIQILLGIVKFNVVLIKTVFEFVLSTFDWILGFFDYLLKI